jgi:hypothetical protein
LQTVCQLFVDNGQAGGHTGGQGENFMSDEMKDGRKLEAVVIEGDGKRGCPQCVWYRDSSGNCCDRPSGCAGCSDEVGYAGYYRYAAVAAPAPEPLPWDKPEELELAPPYSDGEAIISIVRYPVATPEGATRLIVTQASNGITRVYDSDEFGVLGNDVQVRRRAAKPVEVKFTREAFAALGADVLVRVLGEASGDWCRVIWFNNDGIQTGGVLYSWTKLASDAGFQYSTDRGATWQRFTMPAAK